MKVRKSTIPADSLVGQYLPADYSDAYCCGRVSGKECSADDIMVGFWTRSSPWVAMLFRLRNFLVRFVGLKGSEGLDVAAFEEAIRNGGTYGFTSIPAKNSHETVMLLTDKHLDAYLSVYISGDGVRKTVFAITLVKYRNRLGRLYFFVIRPFHAAVVKSMLRRAVGKT